MWPRRLEMRTGRGKISPYVSILRRGLPIRQSEGKLKRRCDFRLKGGADDLCRLRSGRQLGGTRESEFVG